MLWEATLLDVAHQTSNLSVPHTPVRFHTSTQGGMPGAAHLRDCTELEAMVRAQRDSGRLYAALCATPVVFFQVCV